MFVLFQLLENVAMVSIDKSFVICLLQCLQAEYDKLEGMFDLEKHRAGDFEASLKKAAEELSALRMAHAEWIEDKERLRKEIDNLAFDKKVSIIYMLLNSSKIASLSSFKHQSIFLTVDFVNLVVTAAQ